MGKLLIINGADFSANAVGAVTPVNSNIRITVVASPSGGGIVTGSGTYAVGEEIQITATKNSGYKFVQWSDGNTNATRQITVGSTSATYTATFEETDDVEIDPTTCYFGKQVYQTWPPDTKSGSSQVISELIEIPEGKTKITVSGLGSTRSGGNTCFAIMFSIWDADQKMVARTGFIKKGKDYNNVVTLDTSLTRIAKGELNASGSPTYCLSDADIPLSSNYISRDISLKKYVCIDLPYSTINDSNTYSDVYTSVAHFEKGDIIVSFS